ncbi:MAG: YlbF family regulator [Ruminococcaceae bacterium]|nr:YlbF family regulator [Oscillospiraceae bacterium]
MGIFEIAEMLGKTLKEDERLVRLANAKEAYEKDATLGGKLIEFEVQQKALENEMVKSEREMELIDMIQKRIDTLYKEITENEVFVELNEAQAVVNELMNSVNNTIMFNITGELPSSCTHDCSTCGGCH